jgi:ABC-2 type transport system permease protein
VKWFVVARTSIVLLLRDRSNLFFVFLFPLLLVFLIGTAFGATGGIRIGIVGPVADRERLATLLENDGVEVVEVTDADTLAADVRRGAVHGGAIVPPGLRDATPAAPVEVQVVLRPTPQAELVRSVIEAAVAREAATATAVALAADYTDDPEEARRLATRASAVVADIGVHAVEVGTGGLEEDFAGLERFDLGASSQLFLFTFLTGLAAGTVLIQLRELGIARRLAATPTSPRDLLLGLAGGRVLVAAFQAGYIVLATVLLFGVNWGDPLAAVAIILLFCLIAGGAGTLLGATMRNDSQAAGVAVGLGLGLAALGGSMAPLEIFPATMRAIALATPHAWANLAMAETVRRDGGFLDVLPHLGVLAAYATVLLALGTWRLRAALTR